MKYVYYNEILMNDTPWDKARFTLGKEYEYDALRLAFTDDKGSDHFMPHPNDERDDHDGWSTSDYFKEVVQ